MLIIARHPNYDKFGPIAQVAILFKGVTIQAIVTSTKQDGQKDDPIDALKLAQLARGGYIKEIHHPVGQRRRFKELMIAYHDANRSIARIKN